MTQVIRIIYAMDTTQQKRPKRTLYIPDSDWFAVSDYAKSQNRSVSNLVVCWIRNGCKGVEINEALRQTANGPQDDPPENTND